MEQNSEKLCFLFPGQGSQKVGMGTKIATLCPASKQVFECASDIFKLSVLNLCENGEEKLKKTKFAQIAIVTTNLAAFKAIEKNGFLANCLVGHSLGQYCSLYAAKVLSLEETFNLLKIRIDAIEKFAPKENVSMCAIIGESPETIAKECEKASGYVACANFNLKNQTVISGETKAILEVTKKLEKTAKKCVFLNVSSAFHCKLMKDAANSFSEKIQHIVFKNATIPIYSNVTSKTVQNGKEIKSLLIQHFISPVLFTKILANLEKDDVSLFVELGQGTILSSLVKKTLKNTTTLNISDDISFAKTIDFLKNKLQQPRS